MRRIRPATGSPRFAVDLANDAEKADTAVVAMFRGIRTVTTTQPLTKNDFTVLVDASAGLVTVTLPSVNEAPGQTINVKKVDATANLVTIACTGSETIDGAASKTTTTPNACFTQQASPAGWQVI